MHHPVSLPLWGVDELHSTPNENVPMTMRITPTAIPGQTIHTMLRKCQRSCTTLLFFKTSVAESA